MDQFLVWDKVDGDIRLLRMDFYDYLQQQMEKNQFLVYHVCEETFQVLKAKVHTSQVFPFLQKESDYMLTNDLEENCLKLCNYEDVNAFHHYQVKDGNLALAKGKSFIHDNISFLYAKGLHIYTAKTYQDVLMHFMNQKQILEEIEQDMQNWPLEKQKVFHDYFVKREEVKTYFKKKKS